MQLISCAGTILINAGGPGGSSTQMALLLADQLVSFFGPTYDILGFDPRGVGATTPRAHCFDTPQQADQFNLIDLTSGYTLRTDDYSIPMARAKDQALSAACAKKLGGNGKEEVGGSVEDWGAGRFMDTASVATDMLNIVQKLGQEKVNYYGVVSILI